jgi:ABC-2 type transport system ATP-binding protein
MNIISAREINKSYAQHNALENVSADVLEGSVYGLLGPNGAGKTTFIRILNLITAPDKGEVFFFGSPISRKDILNIGYLPEERGLYRKMNVGEQIIYLSRLRGLDKHTATMRMNGWLDKFDLQHWKYKKIEQLSKGMQQKIQFIISVIHQPRLLIFDEPFSGLDPINTNIIKKELLELRKKGTTIILSTHNMNSVEELCDDITLINKAKVILQGNVHSLKQQFKKNLFELIFRGNTQDMEKTLSNDVKIIEQEVLNNDENRMVVNMHQKEKNELLKKALEIVQIESFKEILPAMDEIFIDAVNSN